MCVRVCECVGTSLSLSVLLVTAVVISAKKRGEENPKGKKANVCKCLINAGARKNRRLKSNLGARFSVPVKLLLFYDQLIKCSDPECVCVSVCVLGEEKRTPLGQVQTRKTTPTPSQGGWQLCRENGKIILVCKLCSLLACDRTPTQGEREGGKAFHRCVCVYV